MSLLPAGERRSLGLKFLLVVALAALMTIPTVLVWGLIMERTTRAQQVIQEVGERFGGPQTFTGPILAAPYTASVPTPPTPENPRPGPTVTRGWYMVFAKTGAGDATAETSVRARGEGELFKVRVYTADLVFKGKFELPERLLGVPEGAVVDWDRAVILMGVGDARGAAAPAQVTLTGAGLAAPRTVPLEPGSAYAGILPGDGSTDPGGGFGRFGGGLSGGRQWLVAPAGDVVRPGVSFEVASTLKFTGVERLAFTAFAKDTVLTMQGNWPHVGYFGQFPADAQPTTAQGFKAQWNVPFVARNLAEAGDAGTFSSLPSLTVVTAFVDPSNPYNWVDRALRYSPLFVGIVFLVYFMFEALSPRRAHPAQYVLVGLAQVIFYLLLLSLAERIGFEAAFAAAAAATVAQIGWYAGVVFKDRGRGIMATAIFALLYVLIYMLLKLEDLALLVGSIASFLVVLGVMFATRNLDWYGLSAPKADPPRDRPVVPPDWKPNNP
jgi:inner membrane protein